MYARGRSASHAPWKPPSPQCAKSTSCGKTAQRNAKHREGESATIVDTSQPFCAMLEWSVCCTMPPNQCVALCAYRYGGKPPSCGLAQVAARKRAQVLKCYKSAKAPYLDPCQGGVLRTEISSTGHSALRPSVLEAGECTPGGAPASVCNLALVCACLCLRLPPGLVPYLVKGGCHDIVCGFFCAKIRQ